MSTLLKKFTSLFLCLIFLTAIIIPSVSFLGFDTTPIEQSLLEMTDAEGEEAEDSEEEKFSNYDSSAISLLNIATNLTQRSPDHFVTQFFPSVPVSPPNS